jgi:hypothetical protein
LDTSTKRTHIVSKKGVFLGYFSLEVYRVWQTGHIY